MFQEHKKYKSFKLVYVYSIYFEASAITLNILLQTELLPPRPREYIVLRGELNSPTLKQWMVCVWEEGALRPYIRLRALNISCIIFNARRAHSIRNLSFSSRAVWKGGWICCAASLSLSHSHKPHSSQITLGSSVYICSEQIVAKDCRLRADKALNGAHRI